MLTFFQAISAVLPIMHSADLSAIVAVRAGQGIYANCLVGAQAYVGACESGTSARETQSAAPNMTNLV